MVYNIRREYDRKLIDSEIKRVNDVFQAMQDARIEVGVAKVKAPKKFIDGMKKMYNLSDERANELFEAE